MKSLVYVPHFFRSINLTRSRCTLHHSQMFCTRIRFKSEKEKANERTGIRLYYSLPFISHCFSFLHHLTLLLISMDYYACIHTQKVIPPHHIIEKQIRICLCGFFKFHSIHFEKSYFVTIQFCLVSDMLNGFCMVRSGEKATGCIFY